MSRLFFSTIIKLILCTVYTSSTSILGRSDYGAIKLFESLSSFEVETILTINEITRLDKEVGFKLNTFLELEPVWKASDSEFLLKFRLISPKLMLRGKHANDNFYHHKSMWDAQNGAEYYAHWRSGYIQHAYLDPDDSLDIINYKKSLISLFQFQVLDGEHNETDISGNCKVLYETISMQVIRKFKSACIREGVQEGAEDKVSWRARRMTRYSLRSGLDALEEVHAEDLVTVRPLEGGDSHGDGVKVRTWHTLRLRAERPIAPPATPPRNSLADVLPDALRPYTLQLASPVTPLYDQQEEVERVLSEEREVLESEVPGGGGGALLAAAALRVVGAVRAAPAHTLLQVLRDERNHHILAELCRLFGAAGTRASHTAIMEFLQLRSAEPLERFMKHYFAGIALSAPQEEVVKSILALAEESKSGAVREAALLAGVRSAGRGVRATLLGALARCADDRCRALHLHALTNMREVVLMDHERDAVLTHVEDGSRGVALAALRALERSAGRDALPYKCRARLARVVTHPLRPFEVRAAALDVLVRHSIEAPAGLVHIARALHEAGSEARELRRLLWQRLRLLATRHSSVRDALRHFDPHLTTWLASANPGTSSVLERPTGWGGNITAGGWTATLESVQAASGSLLRRGTVRLLPHRTRSPSPAQTTAELEVEVWTQGMSSLLGGDAAESHVGDDEVEVMSAGLAVMVDGARLHEYTLFEGQTELLGLVWSGAGSEPTSVMRALHVPRDELVVLPLVTGFTLTTSSRAALVHALDAHAQVSLWSRTARAGLELRAGGAASVSAGVQGVWGEVQAEWRGTASVALVLDADIDFYRSEKVALCVRAYTIPHHYTRNVSMWSRQSGERMTVRRERSSSLTVEGVTLSLGEEIDRACRGLVL